MALNWVQPDPGQAGRSPLALPGEVFREHTQSVRVILPLPPTLDGPKRELSSKGSFWISKIRTVFMGEEVGQNTDASQSNALQSLSIPHGNITLTTFNQPLFFGPNSITIKFCPSDGGGLPTLGRGETLDVRLEFSEGQVHLIWQTLEKARQMAKTVAADEAWSESQLPLYKASSG